ncbi:MAG: hypothetical protein ABFE07_28200 [Armatimonadia bacterium]
MRSPMIAAELASRQDESVRGEMIEYWLRPLGEQNFDGKEMVSAEEQEPYGPFVVCDPRCNHGTITDEEVFEYVRELHGEPPLMFLRGTWWNGEDEHDDDEGAPGGA